MRTDQTRAVGVFWALTSLMTDYTIDLTPREVSKLAPLDEFLTAGTGVRIAVPPRRPFADVVRTAAQVADAGMRPVVPVAALDMHDVVVLDRALGALAYVGVEDLMLVGGSPRGLARSLDETVRMMAAQRFRRRQFRSIGIGRCLERQPVIDSADLLRAFDAAHIASADHDIKLYLTTRPAFAGESVIGWERYLRAAGNRLPVRVALPGLVPARRFLRRGLSHPATNPATNPATTVLELASALEADPACLISGLHFSPRGSAVRTARWADDIGNGNFVVEGGVEHGYELAVLSRRRVNGA